MWLPPTAARHSRITAITPTWTAGTCSASSAFNLSAEGMAQAVSVSAGIVASGGCAGGFSADRQDQNTSQARRWVRRTIDGTDCTN
jgi:hypothetical protein